MPHGADRSRILVVSLIGAAIVAAVPAGYGQEKRSSIHIAKGVSLTVSAGWEPSGIRYQNAQEFVIRADKGKEATIQARAFITAESRRDHAEALHRLTEIAREADVQPTFGELSAWPFLNRRYEVPLERRGSEAYVEPSGMSLRVTFAVAAADLVVRLEASFVPGADRKFADQAEALARGLAFAQRGNPDEVRREIEELKRSAASSRTEPSGPGAPPSDRRNPTGPFSLRDLTQTGAAVQVQIGVGEVEVAVSADGVNVVVAANSGYSYSSNTGGTFTFGGGTPAPFPADGDPSVAWGPSGTFYYAFIGYPNGTSAAGGVSGCSTGVSASTDGGVTFPFQNHATVCPLNPPGLCFPDQEHIAADRNNSAPTGGDQVYSVWRNFLPLGSPPTCTAITSGFPTPSIVCSSNSGLTWTTTPFAVGTGDFPRVTVGPDGFTYVVYISGANVMLHKFGSCASGLTPQPGFPVTVASFTVVACPVPGLDRCNAGNTLSSPTVAVSETDPSHVFVSFATGTGGGNENAVVYESLDGGLTFPASVTANGSVTARRFMPWVCATGDEAFVTWYDRRAVTAATSNDLTDFYSARVLQTSTGLSASESNMTTNPDPQCASGWPCGARSPTDYTSCSVQPQPGFAGSGCPKYGDYNGNACANGCLYSAWSSATAPSGLPAATGLTVYAKVRCPLRRILDFCARRPWLCIPPKTLDKELIVLECGLKPCIVLDPIPKNCLVKFDCPGCPPGALCFFHLFLENLDPAWNVELLDVEGRIVSAHRFLIDDGLVLSFRPSAKDYLEGQIANYMLAFEMGPAGKPGKEYHIRTRLEVGDRPYRAKPSKRPGSR